MKRQKTKIIEMVDVAKELKIRGFTTFPWPWAEESVANVQLVGVLEFVPGKLRGKLMDEVYRILRWEGKAVVMFPYWSTLMGMADYQYEWPPLSEASFMYFNKEWREKTGLTGRDLKCDFDFGWGYQLEPEVANRTEEARSFYLKYYTNAVQRMTLTLTKLKRPERKK